jgi:hypothetical protein
MSGYLQPLSSKAPGQKASLGPQLTGHVLGHWAPEGEAAAKKSTVKTGRNMMEKKHADT